MKVAVIGAGAVGAFYGAKLQKFGAIVQYQSKTMSNYRFKNLQIESIWGNFSIPIKPFPDTKNMQVADLIIVATKVTNPKQDALDLLGALKPITQPNSIILILQNGLNMEEKIGQFIPNPILGGLAFTCINRFTPITIKHIDYGLIKIGSLRKEEKNIAKDIVKLFQNAGIETVLAPDLRQARYEKLLWNVPFNSLSVICNTSTEKLINFPETKDLARKLMEETRNIALKEGKKITKKMIDDMIKKTESMKPYKTSMLIDYESKRKMEVESILGELLREGQKAHVSTPHLETVYRLLSFYNSQI